MKIVKEIQPTIVIFTYVKNRCMLHGRVFVMWNIGESRSTQIIEIMKRQITIVTER